MLRQMRSARNDDEGFTLIELLIVIVILGVLAGIVVFGVAQFRTDSTTAACKADLKTVQVAADAYDAQRGSYPAGGNAIALLVNGNYITETPPNSELYVFNAGAKTVTRNPPCPE